MDAVFDALGDATRRRILEVLAGGEHVAGALVEALRARRPISQPAVSQHLKVLRDAGLVAVRAEGTRRFYSVDGDGLRAAGSWLALIADPIVALTQPLDALATEVARGKRQGTQNRRAVAPVSSKERAASSGRGVSS